MTLFVIGNTSLLPSARLDWNGRPPCRHSRLCLEHTPAHTGASSEGCSSLCRVPTSSILGQDLLSHQSPTGAGTSLQGCGELECCRRTLGLSSRRPHKSLCCSPPRLPH